MFGSDVNHSPADDLSGGQQCIGFRGLLEGEAIRDQRLDIDAAACHQVQDGWHVCSCASSIRAQDLDLSPNYMGYVQPRRNTGGCDSHQDDPPAIIHKVDGSLDRTRAAQSLERDIHPASASQFTNALDRINGAGVHHMRCAKVRGQLQFLVVDVYGNNLLGSEGDRHLHDVQTYPADSNNRDGFPNCQLRYILDGTKAGENAASEDGSLGRADGFGEHKDISIRYHAVLGQATHGVHGNRLTASTRQARLAVIQNSVEPIVTEEGLARMDFSCQVGLVSRREKGLSGSCARP